MPEIEVSFLALPLHPIKVSDLCTKDLLVFRRERPLLQPL